ncbi:hypothetical protein MuYL_3015 [Mucilaginibacter xinganensis]|uniref:Uncharacterized protein n=1 Tax=Mucilaginibacter xinganensis TaxID=1234841 RepID=A0A223NYP2_9SPHI|nr:hypothetical protein MuYL_3015 [Mucilaginibacter xinganensis]
MLSFHLFNIGGYLLLHQYFTYKAERFFDEQTSKNKYNVHDLTEIRVPVNMPGITEWASYENVSGHIQFESASYNYVKMKITRTAIYLMCVPNYETTQLSGENIITAKHIKDIPVPKKEHVPFSKLNTIEKFQFNFVQFAFNATIKSVKIYTIQPFQQLLSNFLDIPEQPPKYFC